MIADGSLDFNFTAVCTPMDRFPQSDTPTPRLPFYQALDGVTGYFTEPAPFLLYPNMFLVCPMLPGPL